MDISRGGNRQIVPKDALSMYISVTAEIALFNAATAISGAPDVAADASGMFP
jgi:hypothetical protein